MILPLYLWWSLGFRQANIQFRSTVWPKRSTLISEDHNTFKDTRKAFHHIPHILYLYEEDGRLLLRFNEQPVLARKSCRSFNASVGVLAASQTSFLLVVFSFFHKFCMDAQEAPWSCHCLPHFVHLMMSVFIFFHVLHIFSGMVKMFWNDWSWSHFYITDTWHLSRCVSTFFSPLFVWNGHTMVTLNIQLHGVFFLLVVWLKIGCVILVTDDKAMLSATLAKLP